MFSAGVDKQLAAVEEDDPWGTSPAVQEQPTVQVKRGHSAVHPCYWSGNAGPACSAGEMRQRHTARHWAADAPWPCRANSRAALMANSLMSSWSSLFSWTLSQARRCCRNKKTKKQLASLSSGQSSVISARSCDGLQLPRLATATQSSDILSQCVAAGDPPSASCMALPSPGAPLRQNRDE